MAKSWHAVVMIGIMMGAILPVPQEAVASDPILPLPQRPVSLNIVDVAGNLALTQKAIERYRQTHPNLVSKISFAKAPAPELPGKIKAQQGAGRLDIDLVLTGPDAMAAGIEQKIWEPILPRFSGRLAKLQENYLKPAAAMQEAGKGQGVVVTYYPSGPLLEYAPERVAEPPQTAEALLAYCTAHPGRVLYARPANSGPGRTFLMGLPYILGDQDPKDPIKGWDKTWAFLKALNGCIDYYPSGTTATMKELAEGSRDIIVTTTGWDINPRVLGVVPKSAAVSAMSGFHWVVDAHYMAVPKGLSDEKLAVVLDLMAFLLQPEQQALAYDDGYFYPGPAIKDVPLTMAPPESQDAIKNFGRPLYDKLIAETPYEVPLDADKIVQAFRKWDEEIGASKTK